MPKTIRMKVDMENSLLAQHISSLGATTTFQQLYIATDCTELQLSTEAQVQHLDLACFLAES